MHDEALWCSLRPFRGCVRQTKITMSIQAFDDLLNDSLVPVVQLGLQIGDLVAQQNALVKQAFDMQRSFIEYASKSEKPASDQALMTLLKPTSDLIVKIQVSYIKNF